MEDLPLGRIAALVPEFAVKDLPLDRILMTYIDYIQYTQNILRLVYLRRKGTVYTMKLTSRLY